MRLKRFTTPLIAAVLVLGACEAQEEPAIDDAPSSDSVEALAATPGELVPINRSGVRGRAEAVPEGDELVVTVEAEGLEPGASYATFLHEGRCAEGGAVRFPLRRVVAGEDGTGSVRIRIEPDRVPDASELFVQVHDPEDQPVACANVGPGEAGS